MELSKENNILLFSIQNYGYLAQALLSHAIFEEGGIDRKTFPDGEKYYRLLSDVKNRKVVLIGGTTDDSATMELYDLACGIAKHGAKSLTVVVPYYGYSTMERKVKNGEIVTAKTRARLLSSIPQAYFGNNFLFMDLHSEGIPHYMEGSSRSRHIYAKPLIIESALALGGNDFVLASTDSGRAKWVESLANDMGVEAAFVYKRRSSGTDTQITGINADVNNKNVIIYDDMIRTGGSLINAAKAYKDAGAQKIFVIATHGVLPGNAADKLKNCGLIEKLIVTDTHPNALAHRSDFLEVKSIAGLIASAIVSEADAPHLPS